MIQRIQTVYMLVTAVLMGLMLLFPLASFIGGTEMFSLRAFGVVSSEADSVQVVSTLYMGILISLCALLPFVTIFLYKRRWVQLRLCIVEIILLVGAQIYVCYYIYRSAHSVATFAEHAISYSVLDLFPLVSVFLTIFALRGVIKDETLLKSLNRIR